MFKKGLVLSLAAGIILLLLLANTVTSVAAAAPLNAAELEEFMDSVVQRQMEQFNIANATVSVVAGGEVLLVKGYGYGDLEQKTPVDGDKTLFRIGSTAKLFTWTAVMQLVEQGKLDLDTDINEYLDFEIPARLLHKRGQTDPGPITLRHLMTHTPGFEAYMSDIFFLAEEGLLPLEQHIRTNMPARVFPPGQVIAYSNYGVSLAGYIVERVSGIPFAQYVEENIYEPLGMSYSTFRQPLPGHLKDHLARAYRYVDGEFREGKFEYMSEPAGSMSSTAGDMARFMLAHLQGGQLGGARILQEETVRLMQSRLFTHHHRLNGMAHGFIEGTFNGRRTLFHPGGTMLFDTACYLLPQEEVGFFMSHSGGNYLVNIEVFQAFMDRYFPDHDVLTVPEPAAGAADRSRVFAGEYQQNRRSFTTSDKILGLITGVIRVDADEEGCLLVTHLGETNRFVELEPGVYYSLREEKMHDYGGDFRTIVFGMGPLGKTMLMADGPMSYSKAAWYEQSGLNVVVLVTAILFVLGSFLYWVIKAAIQRIRLRRNAHHGKGGQTLIPGAAKAARWTAVAFGFLTFLFVLAFLSVSEPDPVYILPAAAYGEAPAWSSLLDLLIPLLMAIVGVAVVVFTVLAWREGYWRIAGRIHYTLFAAAAVMLLWIFYFFNLFITIA